jgi:hypothetical protein
VARHSPCGGRRSDNGCYVICGWGRADRAKVVPVVPRAALPIHSKGAGCGMGLWQCSAHCRRNAPRRAPLRRGVNRSRRRLAATRRPAGRAKPVLLLAHKWLSMARTDEDND